MKSRDDLTRTSRAYWESRAVLSGVELGIFTVLGRRRLTAGTLAKRIGTDPRATRLLLDALVGQGVLTKSMTSYAIAGALVPFLTEGPESALGMLRHHARLWHSWSQLSECVRRGTPAEKEGGFRGDAEAARAFTMAMRDGARRLAPGVAEEIPLRGRKLLLDLGGGPGVYAVEFARANPGLAVVVVDLPDVAKVGEECVAEHADVRGRIRYHAADLDTDPLPEGADAAFLSHVIHSQTEEEMGALFTKVAGALLPGGLFVVRDFFLAPDRTEPAGASLFALNMLVNTAGGRTYTAAGTMRRLKRAGFATARFRKSKAVPDCGHVLARLP